MKSGLVVAIILSSVLLFHTASAQMQMGSLVITVKPEKNSLEASEIPVLVGAVTDQASKPVTNAQVNISTSYGTIAIFTDADGKFRYQFVNPVTPGQYIINVKVQKDGYGIGLSSTTFFVKGVPAPHSQQYNFKTVSSDKINQDPIASKILKNMEISKKRQAAQEEKLKKIEDNKKFLEEQRALADQELQNDLSRWLVQLDPFAPRNAYAMFVSEVNQTVQNIFWGQFNFTEQKTNDGLFAKNQVLQNGGSNGEARKAFIQKATSPRDEIIKVNNDLNVKYGHANKDSQSKFDNYGKLSRHNK